MKGGADKIWRCTRRRREDLGGQREESRGKKFGHRTEGCVRREREEREEEGGGDGRMDDGNVERDRTGGGVGHSRDISWLSLY